MEQQQLIQSLMLARSALKGGRVHPALQYIRLAIAGLDPTGELQAAAREEIRQNPPAMAERLYGPPLRYGRRYRRRRPPAVT